MSAVARFIVADDAAVMRALVARAVRAAGYEVVAEAQDADTAVLAAQRLQVDAIVLDSRLPGPAVADTVTRIRAVACETAIFILATLGERDLVRDASLAGAAGALIRPLRPGAVHDAFERVVKSGLP